MKKYAIALPMFVITMLTGYSQADAQIHAKANMFPKNSLSIPVGIDPFQTNGGISEQEFNEIIQKISDVYAPVFEAMGGKLKIRRMWDVDSVNAVTYKIIHDYHIDLYGGLPRHPAATRDGFALVMCHEIGHHLGGFPAKKARTVSNEGQSDYFASMKCFRKVFEKDDHTAILSELEVPEKVKNQCGDSFKSKEEIQLCMRTAMAGKSLATISWYVENDASSAEPKPSFDVTDPSVVQFTNDHHPHAQCRLDTYLAGALCNVSHSIPFGENDPVTGACALEKGDRVGVRPACWYKPELII